MSIRLLEDAFSRQSSYFKSAFFQGNQSDSSFWRGKVEDRQAKSRVTEVAEYWAVDFLLSIPALTPARGTKILSRAIRKILRKTVDVQLKDVIISAALIIKRMSGRRITFRDFAHNYFPNELHEPFFELIDIPEILDNVFELDQRTLNEELRIKSIAINNEVIVRGLLDTFDNLVEVSDPDLNGVVEVLIRGPITSQTIIKR